MVVGPRTKVSLKEGREHCGDAEMRSPRAQNRNIGLICIIIGRMYYQRAGSLPWR